METKHLQDFNNGLKLILDKVKEINQRAIDLQLGVTIDVDQLNMASTLLSFLAGESILEKICNGSYSSWELINAREKNAKRIENIIQTFFEGKGFSAPAQVCNLLELTRKNGKPLVTNNDYEDLYDILNNMIRSALSYIFLARKYDSNTKQYTVSFASNVSLKSAWTLFNIKPPAVLGLF